MSNLNDSSVLWLSTVQPSVIDKVFAPGNGTNTDRGDGAKILAMVTLGFGSFLAGMIPALISERNRNRFPLTTSLLLCFGAGVLLATAVVHILPEVRKEMASNFAEVALCGGFFIIYFIDEFVHYFFRSPSHDALPNTLDTHHSHRSYGTIGTVGPGVESLLNSNSTETNEPHIINGSVNASQSNPMNSNYIENSHYEVINEANTGTVVAPHSEPCPQTMTGTLGLFTALSLHSTIEGLAIGVQNSSTKVLFLLGAIMSHKYVMGFCLGLEFRSDPRRSVRSQFIGVAVFALGAILGIGIGMLIVDLPESWMNTTLPSIQALAGGTLLYVTVCEVIPREKSRWHHHPTQKAAGFAQFFAIFIGFSIMCLLNFFLDDDDA